MNYQEILEEVLKALDVPIVKNNPATAHAIVHLEEMLDDVKKRGKKKDKINSGVGVKEQTKKSIVERVKDILPGGEKDEHTKGEGNSEQGAGQTPE